MQEVYTEDKVNSCDLNIHFKPGSLKKFKLSLAHPMGKIYFHEREKFLLGTQKPEMIKKVLQRIAEEGAFTDALKLEL